MGKSPISMAVFNSYVKLPEGTNGGNAQVSYQPSFAGFHKCSFLAWEHVYLQFRRYIYQWWMSIDEHRWTWMNIGFILLEDTGWIWFWYGSHSNVSLNIICLFSKTQCFLRILACAGPASQVKKPMFRSPSDLCRMYQGKYQGVVQPCLG